MKSIIIVLVIINILQTNSINKTPEDIQFNPNSNVSKSVQFNDPKQGDVEIRPRIDVPNHEVFRNSANGMNPTYPSPPNTHGIVYKASTHQGMDEKVDATNMESPTMMDTIVRSKATEISHLNIPVSRKAISSFRKMLENRIDFVRPRYPALKLRYVLQGDSPFGPPSAFNDQAGDWVLPRGFEQPVLRNRKTPKTGYLNYNDFMVDPINPEAKQPALPILVYETPTFKKDGKEVTINDDYANFGQPKGIVNQQGKIISDNGDNVNTHDYSNRVNVMRPYNHSGQVLNSASTGSYPTGYQIDAMKMPYQQSAVFIRNPYTNDKKENIESIKTRLAKLESDKKDYETKNKLVEKEESVKL